MPILNDYIDVVEAAGILQIHWETVKRLCRERRIPAQKVHNKWLIHKEDIREFAKTYDAHRGLKNRNQNTNRTQLKHDWHR
jgi:excisionase family DNA binding protein